MERLLASATVLVIASPFTALAQCATMPACDAPTHCVPKTCCKRPESTPESAPEGQYVRGPESGEFAGAAESLGVRGFGLRFPEVRIDLPEIRLPHLVKYRKNPEMIVESSRAPYVRGRALEFNQVEPSEPESAPDRPESTPDMCVPPVPGCTVGSREKKLLEELAAKEAELQQMQARFGRLEEAVSRLAQQQQAAAPVQPSGYYVEPTRYEQPAPTKAAPPAPRASRPLSLPSTGGQKRSAATPSVEPARSPSTEGANEVTEVSNTRERSSARFGEWNGSGKSTTVAQRTTRK